MKISDSDSPKVREMVGPGDQEANSGTQRTAPAGAAQLSAALLQWYDGHQRDLPWRRTRDPYRIWVSEIMLQQTRVETVIPYYHRFLERFPDPQTLARASEEEVLSLWSGLGYYSRARNLRKGAGLVCDRHQGKFPRARKAVLAIPGIGRYTSAAILSIAGDQAYAVVDGNVARVLARLYRLEPPEDRSASRLEARAQSLLSLTRPGDHNQAMMELGARICTPRSPACPQCPVSRWCLAHATGDATAYPRPAERPQTVALAQSVLLLRDGRGRLLLERGRWPLIPHLWLPPILDSDLPPFPRWRESLGSPATTVLRPRALGSFRHSITHHRISCTVWGGDLRRAPRDENHRVVDAEQLASIGLSSVALKALRLESAAAPSRAPRLRIPNRGR